MELSRCHYCGAISYRQKVCADTPPLTSHTMYQQKWKIEIIMYEPYRGSFQRTKWIICLMKSKGKQWGIWSDLVYILHLLYAGITLWKQKLTWSWVLGVFFTTTQRKNLSLCITSTKRLIGECTSAWKDTGDICCRWDFFPEVLIVMEPWLLVFASLVISKQPVLDFFLDWSKATSCFVELFEN